ncbi:MAG: glycoside hydrolase family 20 [Pedobacter sp.]|nr:MAG: glycoside hydrolase family 20 [Pedobacter sp.]
MRILIAVRPVLVAICLSLFMSSHASPAPIQLIPQPKEMTDHGTRIHMGNKLNVYVAPGSGLGKHYIEQLLQQNGFVVRFTKLKQACVRFLIDSSTITQVHGYRLTVKPNGANALIQITGNSRKGLIHGLTTFSQLVTYADGRIVVPGCEIADYPGFQWRSFMLDEARHFQGKEVVMKLLDEMAMLKMNIFHWHLVDDQGWRIQIDKYPRLTQIGSRSNFSQIASKVTPLDSAKVSKLPRWYYTKSEIREIIRYATERGIDIVPEIEVPGHVSASLYAYPWLGTSSRTEKGTVYGDLYNVADPAVMQFITDVLDEVLDLFPFKLIHIGGDEADHSHWAKDSNVNKYMRENGLQTYMDLQLSAINKISRHIAARGGRMIGWNEITGENIRNEAHVTRSASEKLAAGTIVQFWDGEVSLVNKALAGGYEVVNSSRFHTYLDYNYESTPLEKTYLFDPVPEGVPEIDRSRVIGLGAQMWGEFTPTTERLYYQIFPRLAALAERGWVGSPVKPDFEGFKARMSAINHRWIREGFVIP